MIGKAGSVGIEEVAQRAGVSTATVSRALSGRGRVAEATRRRVHEAADALGYVVSSSASSLATGRTFNVGVLVPLMDLWFFSTVLDGITTVLMRRGYDVTLYNLTSDADVRRSVFDTFLRRRRVDAVIAVTLGLRPDESDRLAELGLPVVSLGGPDPRFTSLTVDEVALARTATEHLISAGHRRIAHIGAGPDPVPGFHVPTRRREGFTAALAAAGIPSSDALFEPGDFTLDGGRRAAARLFARADRPTAVFAASDEMAVGALLAAGDARLRVPQDVSIVGVDGHDLSASFDVTTVDQFPFAQGERCAQAVLDALDGDAQPTPDLPFRLLPRASTSASAPPPPAAPA